MVYVYGFNGKLSYKSVHIITFLRVIYTQTKSLSLVAQHQWVYKIELRYEFPKLYCETILYHSLYCHSMKQFSWVTCYKTAVWHMTKQFPNLTFDKTAVWPMTKQFSNWTYDKNAVWPMINLQLDLWQNYTLTYDKNAV